MSKQYKALFTLPAIKDYFSDEWVSSTVKEVRQVLKRKDRIVYFLRYARIHKLRNISPLSTQAHVFIEKQVQRFPYLTISSTSPQPRDLLTHLQHYVDLDVHITNKVAFENQTIDELKLTLAYAERAWQSNQSRTVAEYGEPVLIEGNYTWFDLKRSGCRIEGHAMGHCGNGIGRTDERVFSLRSPDKKKPGYWIPHVTLVLQSYDGQSGITGEFKGFGNQKPDAKYHKAIVAFLMGDHVKRMGDGGYLSCNNFKLSDLPREQQLSILDTKPSLFTVDALLDLNTPKSKAMAFEAFRRDFCEDSNRYASHIDFSDWCDTFDLDKLKLHEACLFNDDVDEDTEKVRRAFEAHLDKAVSGTLFTAKAVYWTNEIELSLPIEMAWTRYIEMFKDPKGRNPKMEKVVDAEMTELIIGSLAANNIDDFDNQFSAYLDFLPALTIEEKVTPAIYQRAINELKHNLTIVPSEYGPPRPMIELFSGDIEDFASQFECTTLKAYSDYLMHRTFLDPAVPADRDACRDALTQLLTQNDYASARAILFSYLPTRLLIASVEDQVDALIECDHENLVEGLDNGMRWAVESGVRGNIEEAVDECIKGLNDFFEAPITIEWQDGYEGFQVLVSLEAYLTLMAERFNEDPWFEFTDQLQDDVNEHLGNELKDMVQPYYGFDGFDEIACIEGIVNDLEMNRDTGELQQAA